MKEINEDTNQWKDIPHPEIGRILLEWPSYYPKLPMDLIQFLSITHGIF